MTLKYNINIMEQKSNQHPPEKRFPFQLNMISLSSYDHKLSQILHHPRNSDVKHNYLAILVKFEPWTRWQPCSPTGLLTFIVTCPLPLLTLRCKFSNWFCGRCWLRIIWGLGKCIRWKGSLQVLKRNSCWPPPLGLLLWNIWTPASHVNHLQQKKLWDKYPPFPLALNSMSMTFCLYATYGIKLPKTSWNMKKWKQTIPKLTSSFSS